MSIASTAATRATLHSRQLSGNNLDRKRPQKQHGEARNLAERSGIIPVGRKFLDFIHAQLKIQVTGLQNATEIKLNPEISVITRYMNIQLVKLNKAWISRLIMAAWTHIRLFSVGIFQFCA